MQLKKVIPHHLAQWGHLQRGNVLLHIQILDLSSLCFGFMAPNDPLDGSPYFIFQSAKNTNICYAHLK